MRSSALIYVAVVLSGCAAASPNERADVVLTAGATPRDALLPAGTCGFDGYLVDECSGQVARFVVTLAARIDDAPRAEAALDRARRIAGLAGGYPFAIDFDDLAAKDAKRRGIAIVLGVFATEETAAAWRSAHEPQMTELLALATPKEAETRSKQHVAIEVVTATSAWDEDTLTALAQREPDRSKRELARAGLVAACTIEPGRVFRASRDVLYGWQREYAPVDCHGKRAWIPWRSTRLESVVTRRGGEPPIIHQIIDVQCDSPTIEDRPFGARAGALVTAPGTCRS